MQPTSYHVAVVGGGSAGYAAARTTAAAGLRTVVIDGAEELGGLCILRGCMPTKALLYAAEVLHLARGAATWGIRAPDVGHDFSAVMAHKDALIREFADYRAAQLTDGRFELRRSRATFQDAHTLMLQSGETIRADHIVVATGSVVSPPPLPALADIQPLTSDTALRLKRAPESLIVLGGGAVALEFAQCFARFDTRVTVVQRSPRVLKAHDADVTSALEAALRAEGIEVFTDTRLCDAGRTTTGKWVAFDHGGRRVRVEAEEVLLALGRTPATAGLGLEALGVHMDGHRILAGLDQRTHLAHVFAAGDCTGPYEIVHLAIQQGETAAHNIVHPQTPRAMDYRLLLEVVFTDPQVAVVGLTEGAATQRGIPYRAASYPFHDHGKSMILGAKHGLVKLLAAPHGGEILGGACVGAQGGELIHEIVAAMAKRMTVAELASLPHYHPTLAELWTYPAEALAGELGPPPQGNDAQG